MQRPLHTNQVFDLYRSCRLCPRSCRVDRTARSFKAKRGFCRQGSEPVVAYIGPHFGEEPPISGINGSGTVFFSGCTLGCLFCQNYQISHDGMGKKTEIDSILKALLGLIEERHVHNVNFVTPDQFFPHVFLVTDLLREHNHDIPVLYNLSGFQSVEILRVAEPFVDIYLPDFKFSDPDLAGKLTGRKDYPSKALDAIAEMVRQKGFLDSFLEDKELASKGVLVRHLILPGQVDNSKDVLTSLFLEFGPELPISIMSQYSPVTGLGYGSLSRRISEEEFTAVYSHAMDLGFENLFVQFPEEEGHSSFDLVPDFSREKPFGW